MFRTTKKTRLFEDIVNQIKAMIENNSLVLGDQLPSESELASQFGVSRVTIREALRVLELLGLVQTLRGKGTVVTASTSQDAKSRVSLLSLARTKDLMNLIEVREIVEPEVAAHAAKDATEEDIARMESALREMANDIDQGGIGAEGAIRFHHEIIRSVKNEILSNLMGSIIIMIERGMHITLHFSNRPKGSHREHTEILESIRSHDQDRARQAMKRHLKVVRHHLELTNISGQSVNGQEKCHS